MVLPFPFVGADHPLRREQTKTFAHSAALAALITAALGLSLGSRFQPVPAATPERVRPFEVVKNLLPPPVSPPAPPRVDFAGRVEPIPYAIPEPVPVAELEEFPEALTPSAPPDDILADPGTGPSEPAPNGGGSYEWVPGPEDYVAVDVPAELLEMDFPAYPELAQAAGVEGLVVVRVLVAKDGSVHGVRLEQSVDMLDEAAIGAARSAEFRPATRGGRPVMMWVAIPFHFTLDE